MKKIFILLAILNLAACNETGSSTPAATQKTPAPVEEIAPVAPIVETPAPTPTPATTVSVTYYSLSETVAPVGGQPTKTYTATGSCLLYLTKTYCWDDGLKTINLPPSTVLKYSYFGINVNGAGFQNCFGGCTNDYMPITAVKEVSGSLLANITSFRVNQIFSNGNQTTATCTESGTVLNCGSFSINL